MKPSTVKSPLSCSRPIAPGDLPPSIHPVSSVSRPFSVPGPYEGQLLENSGGVRDELRASKKQNGVATLTPVHRSGTSRSSRGSSRRGSYQTLPQRLRERGCRRHPAGERVASQSTERSSHLAVEEAADSRKGAARISEQVRRSIRRWLARSSRARREPPCRSKWSSARTVRFSESIPESLIRFYTGFTYERV
jgi:hypothetical protein